MRTFIPEILKTKNWTATDVIAFHMLPDVPYFAGVYEISSSAFAKILNVSHKTAGKFFEKLAETNYVEVLRNSNSGRYAGIAFTRKDSSLHNKNYQQSGKVLTFQNDNPYYIHLPKSFLKSPPKQSVHLELLKLINRNDLKYQSVHSIMLDYVLTDNKEKHDSNTGRAIIKIA